MLMEILIYVGLGILVFFFLLFLVLLFGWRALMRLIARKVGDILLTDSYQENLLEMIPGFRHMGIQNVIENNLRAEKGDLLHRPLGSSKKWPNLDSLTFLPTQTGPFPVSQETLIDVAVTIGPHAKKPLQLYKPFLIAGMAYGIALSDDVRMALVDAANETGIAINSGEGAVLPEELKSAKKFILQFSKTEWSKEEETIKQADMIEIKLGQGSMTGLGTKILPENLTGKAREVMGLKEDEVAVIREHFFDNQTAEDMKELISDLRRLTGGVPIGVKFGAGGKIEQDIDNVLEMGVDFIAIDGGQAATMGSPPLLADDFGIPTFHAVVRASNHLKKRKKQGQVSLIISGGLMNPGHFLKVLALGADAVYLGSVMLFTVAHRQVLNTMPFEPPTQVVWNEGKHSNTFDQELGADASTKLINASTEEIKQGIRAMGKTSLQEVSRKDLVSYDEATAKQVGIPFTLEPWEEDEENQESGEEQQDTEKGKNSEENSQNTSSLEEVKEFQERDVKQNAAPSNEAGKEDNQQKSADESSNNKEQGEQNKEQDKTAENAAETNKNSKQAEQNSKTKTPPEKNAKESNSDQNKEEGKESQKEQESQESSGLEQNKKPVIRRRRAIAKKKKSGK